MKEIKILAGDLGGSEIRLGVIRLSGGKKEIITGSLETGPAVSDLNGLLQFIEKRMNQDIAGIGLAVAGIVENGTVVESPNIQWLNGVFLQKILADKFGVPVCILNDMDAAVRGMACLTGLQDFLGGYLEYRNRRGQVRTWQSQVYRDGAYDY